jgi:hypothetical protein
MPLSNLILDNMVMSLSAGKLSYRRHGVDLVPQPIFISKPYLGGILFLGFQLGNEPNRLDDYNFNLERIFKCLKSDYGLQYNDAAGM